MITRGWTFLRDRERRRVMMLTMSHALLTKASSKGKAAKATKAKAAKATKQLLTIAHAPKMPVVEVVRLLTRAEKMALADHAVEEQVADVVAHVLQRKTEVNPDLVAMLLGKRDDVLPL